MVNDVATGGVASPVHYNKLDNFVFQHSNFPQNVNTQKVNERVRVLN